MKRKPLKFQDQWRQVQFHTHQHNLEHMCAGAHYVSLPEPQSAEDINRSTTVGGAPLTVKLEAVKASGGGGGGGGGGGSGEATSNQTLQPRTSLPLGGGAASAGNATTSSSMPAPSALPSSSVGQFSRMSGVSGSSVDHRQRIAMVEQIIKDENMKTSAGGVSTGIMPLPPQFNPTPIPQQIPQPQPARPNIQQQVMPQHAVARPVMFAGGPRGPGGEFTGHPQQQVPIHNFLTQEQKRHFHNLSVEQKRIVMVEARQRMMQHLRMTQQPQQRMMPSRPQLMSYRQPMPQSGPLQANPPMPMQQIMQQRHSYPAQMQQQHPPGMLAGQHHMMRQPAAMYQQGTGFPAGMPRPQHNMQF